MKKNPINIITSILFLIFFTSASMAQSDHDMAKQLRDAKQIKPLEMILQQYSKQYPSRILEVELETEHEQFIYEIELLDRQGIVWKLKIDAIKGTLLTKQKDD